LKLLRRVQKRRCGATGERLLKDAEVDHRTPLYEVWRQRASHGWPDLLGFWGAPNLQAVNREAHRDKSIRETGARALAAADQNLIRALVRANRDERLPEL
jgi:5-methylcytosine-specific restriction endonuclease McrA